MASVMERRIQDLEIVPQLITEMPLHGMEVQYGNIDINFGNILKPTNTELAPTHIRYPSNPKKFYTLLFLDPDVPSRQHPKYRFWMQWLVGNIPGDSIISGDELCQYVGPLPPRGTDFHRYIFLVYEQEDKEHFYRFRRLGNTSAEYRTDFDLDNFVDTYALLNPPHAINFFEAQFDPTCNLIYNQLTPIIHDSLLNRSTWLG